MKVRTKHKGLVYKRFTRNIVRGHKDLFANNTNIYNVNDYRNGGPYYDPTHIHFYQKDGQDYSFLARADIIELYYYLVDYIVANRYKISHVKKIKARKIVEKIAYGEPFYRSKFEK